jgi:hypothetical protein
VQLYFDGVLSRDRAIPIEVRVGTEPRKLYIADGISTGSRDGVDDLIAVKLRPHTQDATITAAIADLRTSWRIVHTEVWRRDVLDLLQIAFFRFDEDSVFGEFGLVALGGGLHCYHGQRDGKPLVDFSWNGDDDGRPKNGRGYAMLESDGKLHGRLYIHQGDDSGFVAERSAVRLSGVPASTSPRSRRSRRPG